MVRPICELDKKLFCTQCNKCKMMSYNLPVVFYNSEDLKYIIASCPILGVTTQGETLAEAMHMIDEAVELYLQDKDVQIDLPWWDTSGGFLYMERTFQFKK